MMKIDFRLFRVKYSETVFSIGWHDKNSARNLGTKKGLNYRQRKKYDPVLPEITEKHFFAANTVRCLFHAEITCCRAKKTGILR
jgi:hypothetical protein